MGIYFGDIINRMNSESRWTFGKLFVPLVSPKELTFLRSNGSKRQAERGKTQKNFWLFAHLFVPLQSQ